MQDFSGCSDRHFNVHDLLLTGWPLAFGSTVTCQLFLRVHRGLTTKNYVFQVTFGERHLQYFVSLNFFLICNM